MSESNTSVPASASVSTGSISRKSFLKVAGASAAAAATFGLAGCDNEDELSAGSPVYLGSGDVGVLNFAYALEQLEAAFYIRVMSTPYDGMSSEEGQILEDLRKHEVAHRDWFKAVLGSVAGSDRIPELTPNFNSIDFSDRSQVLATARALEDTGVGAYNGAGQFIQNTDYLLQAGKIVSVEARHAAAIRDLINPGSAAFAGDDVVNPNNGLGLALTLQQVLGNAGPFITEQLDASDVGR